MSALTFVFGAQRFAPLASSHRHDPEVVVLGGVKVLDEQLCFLLGHLNLRLLPTWNPKTA